MGLAAAAVIAVAAMGMPLGVWLGMRHRPQPEPPRPAATPVQKAVATPTPVAPAAAPAKNTEVIVPQPPPVAEANPATLAARPTAGNGNKLTKAARKSEPPRRPVALQSAPVPVVQGLATLPASAIVASQPVVDLPRAVRPTPPAGRLFESGEVDDAPRVATRVAPQVPDDLLKRYPRDVVVVRVLVSQTGHPFRVSLLRHSLGGRPVDDAVVAAVSSWTFSPARKRGEAVSCWMNFGVPVSQ